MQCIKRIVFVLALTAFCLSQQSGFAQAPDDQAGPLPLATDRSASDYVGRPMLTIPQQRAKFAADQRMLRLQWNEWIGYSPLRPQMNGSYMSNGVHRYYIPRRGVIVSAGPSSYWYW